MKFALILGASGDIGQACARRLASKGWSLYCHYHQNETRVKTLIENLEKKYPRQDFFSLQLDMTDEKRIEAFTAQLFEVDAVIVASGQTIYKLLTDTTSREMDQLWQMMVKTPMLICQKVQEKLARKKGSIVFIGSVYGISGSAMEVLYSTLKGAQHAFVKAYGQESASLDITVNAIAPGAVRTHMNYHWTEEETRQLLSEIPANRMAEADEIAAVVQFLLGEHARYITGTIIPVTGGWKV
ncbi:elongation factor P 5-aminopentanone reductase [Vagococcus elongatus]|uniref:3-oxoacyl-ACP reductase n=1 Tax=Vagococcus elongatus TaxID=180344 RepID=A0A430B151_9ENTE|nr:SDR family oxidoreductase [Vagococcus elongatus]RSU14060.1 3-oxoacyl-ACP reductase [Vagococcus elongatus]